MEPPRERSKEADLLQYKNSPPPPNWSRPTQRPAALWGGELSVLRSVQAEIVVS